MAVGGGGRGAWPVGGGVTGEYEWWWWLETIVEEVTEADAETEAEEEAEEEAEAETGKGRGWQR